MKNSRATFAHKSIVLNEHYTATDPPTFDRTKAQDTIVVDYVLLKPAFRDTRDPLHLAQGGTLGRVHKGMLTLTLQGRILAPNAAQLASLEEREKALRLAFDPYECYRDSPSTDGAYALSWLEPTTDTTNYPTGYIPVTRYVRPTAQPETRFVATDGPSRPWSVSLLAPDPRLYTTTGGTITVNGAGPAGVVNTGTIAGPLRVTITMSGAGATNFTITRSGVSFVLNLSGCVNNDVVVVTMETCGPFGTGRRITKNGADAFSLKTSGPTTWLDAPVGTTSFTHANTTNVNTVKYDWGNARP